MARLDLASTFGGISNFSVNLIQSPIPVRVLTVHASLDEHFVLQHLADYPTAIYLYIYRDINYYS